MSWLVRQSTASRLRAPYEPPHRSSRREKNRVQGYSERTHAGMHSQPRESLLGTRLCVLCTEIYLLIPGTRKAPRRRGKRLLVSLRQGTDRSPSAFYGRWHSDKLSSKLPDITSADKLSSLDWK